MNWLRKRFVLAPTRRPSNRPDVRLGLEALEDRTVPTVVVEPHFPGVQVTSPPSATDYSLQSEPVVLIFAGKYWQTSAGQQDETTLTDKVQALLGSDYLTGLEQYGSDGKASLYTTTTTATPVALQGDFPAGSALMNYVRQERRADPGIVPPTSSNPQSKPVYFVINDPADSGPGGYDYGLNWDNGKLFSAYVATRTAPDGSVDADLFTETFSHELAESTANSIVVTDPGHLNAGTQICDNEPENGPGYIFRVDGVAVQAYWSVQDSAWIVPDGSTTTTKLNAIWAGGTFTGFYSDADATAPQPGTGTAVVGRDATYVIDTGGALWQHTGSDANTGWTQLVNGGVTQVSVGIDDHGNDAVFVDVGGALLEHTGTDNFTGWKMIWSEGIDFISASQVQANTVFLSYQGDAEEYQGNRSSPWTILVSGGVTGVEAGLGSNGKAAAFVDEGGTLKEYSGGQWYLVVANGVTAFSASQVQANTVFFSNGNDSLWKHAGLSQTLGFAKLADGGVTAFSAGDAGGGKAAVFVSFGGDLWDYTGASDGDHIQLADGGVTSFSAAQSATDTVFAILGNQVKEHSGQDPSTGWTLIL